MGGYTEFPRRAFLAGALTTGAAAAFIGAARAAGSSSGKVVVGLSGGGSWRDSVDKLVGAKIRAAGGSVEYLIDAPQGNIARLFAARGGPAPFDVLESGPNLVQLAQRVVVDLDYSKIPNAAALPSYMRSKDYVWNCASEDCVVYNTEIFKANDIPVPIYYKDLAHPKLKGKVAIPDISHVQHWNAVVGMAYDGGGDESKMEAAIPIINQIHPAYFYTTSTDLAQRMASGEIWASAWHSGWAVRLRKSGSPMGAAYMKIGSKRGALWPVILQCTKGAPNPAGGLSFIDAYLDPEVQSRHAKATGVVPANPWALTTLADDPIVKELMILDAKGMADLYVVDFAKLDQAKWRDMWNRDVIRN